MVSAIQFIDMDFEFFEKLSKRKAHAFLQRFLKVESSNIKQTLAWCVADGIKTDYSTKSISPFMRWILKRLVTVPLKPDPAVPRWIRNTDSYAKSLFEFDESSRILTMQAAYYLGESFVKNHNTLRWDTGDIKTAEGNTPVVVGFQHGLELGPILVADNLLRRVAAEPQKAADFEKAVEYWNSMV
jgi:hypothetical protein